MDYQALLGEYDDGCLDDVYCELFALFSTHRDVTRAQVMYIFRELVEAAKEASMSEDEPPRKELVHSTLLRMIRDDREMLLRSCDWLLKKQNGY